MRGLWNAAACEDLKSEGKLNAIATIKFWELASHLHKKKGRIVFRGDCAKDKNGGGSARGNGRQPTPTSVQGLNACLAWPGTNAGKEATNR